MVRSWTSWDEAGKALSFLPPEARELREKALAEKPKKAKKKKGAHAERRRCGRSKPRRGWF